MADALMKELQQLIDWRVKRPRDTNTLSRGEKKSPLKYLMFFLKENDVERSKDGDALMGENNDCTSRRRR